MDVVLGAERFRYRRMRRGQPDPRDWGGFGIDSASREGRHAGGQEPLHRPLGRNRSIDRCRRQRRLHTPTRQRDRRKDHWTVSGMGTLAGHDLRDSSVHYVIDTRATDSKVSRTERALTRGIGADQQRYRGKDTEACSQRCDNCHARHNQRTTGVAEFTAEFGCTHRLTHSLLGR